MNGKRLAALILCLAALLHAGWALAQERPEGECSMPEKMTMRIMTANIWGDYFENPVQLREDAFIEAFAAYHPDVIGLQEMTQSWYDSRMFAQLQERYAIVGAVLGEHVNYVPLAYAKERFELLESGFQRYSDTPDRSKAITYAVLQEKESGKLVAVCNTHFWWKSGKEHDLIRLENARELVQRMRGLQQQYDCPVFAFGDLNCALSSGVFDIFEENLVIRLHGIAENASRVSSHHGNPALGADGRYHGKEPVNPDALSIDHILGLLGEHPCEVTSYQVVLDQAVLDASDHSPVYADIAF